MVFPTCVQHRGILVSETYEDRFQVTVKAIWRCIKGLLSDGHLYFHQVLSLVCQETPLETVSRVKQAQRQVLCHTLKTVVGTRWTIYPLCFAQDV